MKITLLLNKWSRLLALSAFPFLLAASAQAQCLTNTSQYPGSTVVPTQFDGVTPNSISSCNYEEEYAVVQVNANQYHLFYSSNPNTYITISADGGTSAAAHGQGQVAFTSTTAGTVRVYFNTNASCGTYDDCIETNVIIGSNPICFLPLGMPVYTNLTNNSVNFSWNAVVPAPSGGYEYYYGNPANPPSATTPASGSTTSASVSLSPLTQNTDYGFWVRAVCGPNNKSSWGMVNEFTTQHIISRPWAEPFNTNWDMPDGFTDNEYNWFVYSDPGYFDGNPGDFILTEQYEPGMYQFETVNISGILATDVLKFDFRYFDYYSAPMAPPANDGYFKVFISTNMGQTYTQIDSIVNNTTAVWATKSYPLSAYAGQTVRIKIESYYTSTNWGDYVLGFDNFFIGAPCTPPVVNLGIDTTICQGTTLTLNAGSTTGATYAWSTGATTPTLAVTTAGTYSVTVTQAGCSASDTIVVATAPNPVVNLGADTTLCDVSTFSLDAGTGNGYTYHWSNNATTQTINVTTAGTYSVTVTNANGCTGSDEIAVDFSTLPTVTGITATGNPSPTFNFSASGASHAENYHWDFGHNGATATGATATYTYPALSTPATYTVTLTISNDCGDAEVTTVVTVNPVGINELGLDNNSLKLYPNPGSHSVKLINESNYKMKQVIITNILGQFVANIPVKNNAQQVIDVNRLPAGLYNVRIEFEEGTVIRKLEVIK